MSEEELPVCGRVRSGEEGNDLQGAADGEGGAQVACVEGAAGEGADEEDEEDLDRADPGDVGKGAVEGLNVVGLEKAPGADVAEAVEDNQVACGDLGPGGPAGHGLGTL